MLWPNGGDTTRAFTFERSLYRTALVLIVLVGRASAAPAPASSPTPAVTIQSVRIGNADVIPSGLVVPPTVIGYTPAGYTAEARQHRIQGTVTVQALFDIDGNFTVLRVVKGLGDGLDEKALTALQSWRFAPAQKHGERVSVIAEIEIPFKLPASTTSQIPTTPPVETMRIVCSAPSEGTARCRPMASVNK